jgi:hypothetical protein
MNNKCPWYIYISSAMVITAILKGHEWTMPMVVILCAAAICSAIVGKDGADG